MDQNDYLDAGLKVFGLHPIIKGMCSCDDPECTAIGKHPVMSNWQHTPNWSDEQIDTMSEMGHFDTGFGVLVDGLIIIDVDARNGGVESFNKLCADTNFDFLGECQFAVATGSGNGSMHLYFKAPANTPLMQKHNDYEGIDFKSSGYVVGCGSLHASGQEYELLHGSPDDIGDAPLDLISTLKKPEYYRSKAGSQYIDVNQDDLQSMLDCISSDCDYDDWIKIGMALNHIDAGMIDLWDKWSAKSSRYCGYELIQKHWHSFGKCANPVTVGTIIHLARDGGYIHHVEGQYEVVQPDSFSNVIVDLKRPPGFVGDLTQWINDQCLYPRESLAVATALTAIGNICGLNKVDGMDGMTTNLFCFCVAGSATGKESVQQSYIKIMKESGIAGTVHGAFKSEQEVIRNLIRHQSANYVIDEMGIVLSKVSNASKRGGASYLEGLIGLLMSIYSKADGSLPISGDLRKSIEEELLKELGRCQSRVDENEDPNGQQQKRVDDITQSLVDLESGLKNPFLSIIGYTTPVTFNDLMDFNQATNGFLARALLFNDLETNPKRKPKFKKAAMSEGMKNTLQALFGNGSFDNETLYRIEQKGDRNGISTTDEGRARLDDVYDHFWRIAEENKSNTGLEAIPRRGYEIVAKVSTILAAPSGLRTIEHVDWAFALARRDIDEKIKLAYSNMQEDAAITTDTISAKLLSLISHDHGETLAVLNNRCKKYSKDEIFNTLSILEKQNKVRQESIEHPVNKILTTKYFQV
jgi:hypothetical protein